MGQVIDNFEDFKLNKQLLNAVADMGYSEPTPIQQKAIPLVQAGHDVLGIAQTGTGKTAAFLLPMLYDLKYAQGNDLRGLVLAPTRELVMQIEENARALSTYTDLRIVSLYGGKGAKSQIEALEPGVDLIVATPGRFLDIYRQGYIVTKPLKYLVMDEADKMMDMGFMPQIRQILEKIPVKRQNLLFSATFPPAVETLSHEFLEFPERVEVAPQATAAETVAQAVYEVPNMKTKINLLEHLLQDQETFHRVMIFTRTKKSANDIFKFLTRRSEGDIRVIHANKDQNARINAMEHFKDGETRVLVTTDVSARGIDVKEVSHVINFDIPWIHEDYVHRIGRTGRAFAVGEALSFANPGEIYHIAKIEELIRMEIPRQAIPSEVEVPPTEKEELIEIAREIDTQKRKEDPTFKGAFHEKKKRPHQDPRNQSPGRGNTKG
ncbi:MAG TPA: hypothetical protein DCE41_11890, partial [Cytophagales bacterium]|nr:hypothetical protein [Cytophagales bacterium]